MLQLRLLGVLGLVRDGRRIVLPPSKRTRALFAYLVTTGRRHRRERLCELFWGLSDDPRGALRWSLSKLRPLVDEPGCTRIEADREYVGFNAEGIDVDVLTVRERCAAGLEPLSTRVLEELTERFEGSFLEGLDLPEQHAFAAWCVGQRDEATQLHVRLRRTLIERYGEGAEAALRHARVLFGIDPLSEASHALLYRLLRATGRSDEAERQFHASVRFLREQEIDGTGELEAIRRLTPTTAATVPPAPSGDWTPPRDADSGIDMATDRKPATVLFAAFPGFLGEESAVPAADPEVILARVDALTQLTLPHIVVLRGEVISIKSDGILAIFGAPLAQEDHAARACQAALNIAKAVHSTVNAPLRLGLASGEVIVRPGSGSQTWETLGHAIELAPRIAEAAPAGSVAVTGAVFKQVEGHFGAEAFRFAGETLYRVTTAASMRTRWRARAFRSLARFVGRDVQNATFGRAIEDARQGCGSIAAVIGEAGIGKSRMVAENLDRVRLRGDWKVFETGTSPRESQITFAPLRVVMHAWLGTTVDTPPATIEEWLRSRLGGLGPGYPEYVPALLNLLGLSVDDPDWLGLGVEQRRQNTTEALVSVLLRESDDHPVIVLFEDLHWVDEGTQEFLDFLASAIGRARFLLVVTCRPEYNVPWATRSNYVQCRLDALSAEETRAFLDDVLGADAQLATIKVKLARHCEGNPLFLEECVRTLIETESLVGRAGAFTAVRPLADVSTPATVQGIVAARIDRLTPQRRLVLQAASVIGRSFSSELLATVTERPLADVREALAELDAAEFVSLAHLTPVRGYRFVHAVTQQVTYGGMLQARRTGLHRAVGITLQRQAGDRVSEIVETIADHLDMGELWDEASDYRLRAARRSKEQYAYEAGLEHAVRAVACARSAQNVVREVEARTLMGDVHSLMGNLETANESYGAAYDRCADAREKLRIAARRHVVGSIVRDGGRIAYYEHGAGSQILAFVHPLVYGVATFQPLVEQLSSDFRIITIDPRGTGASDPLPARYGIDDHMRDVVAVLAAATHGEPVVAVGISRGALLLVRLAALHPARLSKMILVGSPLKQTVGIDVPLHETPAFGRRKLAEFAHALRTGDIARALEMFMPTIFSERGTGELRRRFIEQCLKLPPATIVNFFTFDPDVDVTDFLERITTPTLVVHGTEDLDTPVSTAVELSKRIAGAELHLFGGKGHLPMFTATADFCSVLRTFVQGGVAR